MTRRCGCCAVEFTKIKTVTFSEVGACIIVEQVTKNIGLTSLGK